MLKKAVGLPARAAVLICIALGGCSVSLPMGSLIGSHEDDQTASVGQPQIGGLEGEDWRRAKVALASALGPEGNGAAVPWDNPDSGTKGSFAAIGEAYATDSGTCRGFRAAIDRKDADDSLQGTACADKSGDWVITDVKPWNKS
ncbi:MAG TPA: RT0821/Lpp0805 family surface protein [Methylovirgula sp.]|nr:RT0821/Lpp0805 family surface protein [Methylovirgula sp.]